MNIQFASPTNPRDMKLTGCNAVAHFCSPQPFRSRVPALPSASSDVHQAGATKTQSAQILVGSLVIKTSTTLTESIVDATGLEQAGGFLELLEWQLSARAKALFAMQLCHDLSLHAKRGLAHRRYKEAFCRMRSTACGLSPEFLVEDA
jgi:hypothetical protein